MKKNRIITILAMAGAALVLAACTSKGTPLFPYAFSFESSWIDGNSKEWIVCEDVDTRIEYTFRIGEGQRVTKIQEVYEGEILGETKRYSIDPNDSRIVTRSRQGDATQFTVTRTIPAGSQFVPLSLDDELSTQAIVVRPIENPAPTTTGGATFQLYVKSGNAGYTIPGDSNAVELTVVSNCKSA